MTDTVVLHPVVMVAVEDLKTDPSNPNEMTPEQVNGLRESFARFGYLEPVIADRNTMLIADGEHRLKVYKESGADKIPAILLDLKDDAERRLLRQTMNKLRGRHDPDRDIDEIRIIYEAGRLDDLSRLAAIPDDTLKILATGENFVADKAWQGMPETQPGDASTRTVNVHFENEKNVQRFAKLIGQRIGPTTRSIWYPYRAPEKGRKEEKWVRKNGKP